MHYVHSRELSKKLQSYSKYNKTLLESSAGVYHDLIWCLPSRQ